MCLRPGRICDPDFGLGSTLAFKPLHGNLDHELAPQVVLLVGHCRMRKNVHISANIHFERQHKSSCDLIFHRLDLSSVKILIGHLYASLFRIRTQTYFSFFCYIFGGGFFVDMT